VYILSGAVAFAKTKISNNDITSFQNSLGFVEQKFGFVDSRCSVLAKEDYFKLAGKDRFQADQNGTPTILGAEALTVACESLGIALGDIGILIADCSTPRQTLPSEAQRIAGLLGLKIPSYDILSPVIAPLMHFKLLNSWKKNQLPKYIALLYSNTPSCEISPSLNAYANFFGDGACALIVSFEDVRGLRVSNVNIQQRPSDESILSVYANESSGQNLLGQRLFNTDQEILKEKISQLTKARICLASPSIEILNLAEQLSEQTVLTGGVSQSGFALSTSVAATIIEALSFGEKFNLVACVADSFASATLERVGG